MFGTQKQKKKVRGDKATGRDRGGGGGTMCKIHAKNWARKRRGSDSDLAGWSRRGGEGG